MWLIIRDSDGAVVGTNYAIQQPVALERHTVKEWFGAEPALHDPMEGVESYDPTLDNPDYVELAAWRVDFGALAVTATNEIAWLDEVIPQIDSMELRDLRVVLKRLAQENRQTLKAWRYVVRRLRGNE